MDDQLILPKLHFFSYVAGIVEPFLKTYQTDNPMIPFLYFDLKAIVKQLLELIVESSVIDAHRSGRELKKINLEDKKSFLSLEKNECGSRDESNAFF